LRGGDTTEDFVKTIQEIVVSGLKAREEQGEDISFSTIEMMRWNLGGFFIVYLSDGRDFVIDVQAQGTREVIS
jgi:CRISPR/Cas system CMR-associated protein Cmr3 (group 5 of RAMP superfamily)